MRALLRPASLVAAILVLFSTLMWTDSTLAITAPELRGQRAVQEITADMHGLDLKEKEFLKADLRDVDLSGTVDFNDILSILAAYGSEGDWIPEDVNIDGIVDFADILQGLADWGVCSG